MDKSFMATVYVIGIAVFFLVLVIMTIMFIVSKIKHRNDDLYDEDEYEDENETYEDDDVGADAYEDDTTAFANAYANAKYADQDEIAYADEAITEELVDESYDDEDLGDIKIPEIPFGVTDDTYVNTFDESDSAFAEQALTPEEQLARYQAETRAQMAQEEAARAQAAAQQELTPEEQLARYQAETRAQMAQEEASRAQQELTPEEQLARYQAETRAQMAQEEASRAQAAEQQAEVDSAFGDSAFAEEVAATNLEQAADVASDAIAEAVQEPVMSQEEQVARAQLQAAREQLARIQAETRAQLARQEEEKARLAAEQAAQAAQTAVQDEAGMIEEDFDGSAFSKPSLDKPAVKADEVIKAVPMTIEESATGMIDVAAGVTGMVSDMAGAAAGAVGATAGVAGATAGVAGATADIAGTVGGTVNSAAGAVVGTTAGVAAGTAGTAGVVAGKSKKQKKEEFKPAPSGAPSTDRFYWFNKNDVAARPSYKTEAMYYQYFEDAEDIIEDLLVEMYDNALVRTEEIRYIAYGIAPRAVSMKEILASGNAHYDSQARQKEPSTQDLIKIYEKWCGYVEKLFGIIEFHADSYTVDQIHTLLCEFGKSDVDILIQGM